MTFFAKASKGRRDDKRSDGSDKESAKGKSVEPLRGGQMLRLE